MNGILVVCHWNSFDRVICSTNVQFLLSVEKKDCHLWIHGIDFYTWSFLLFVLFALIRLSQQKPIYLLFSTLCHQITICAQTICYISRLFESASLFERTKQKKGWMHVVRIWTHNSNRIIVPRYANNGN